MTMRSDSASSSVESLLLEARVPRSGHAADRDLGASLEQVLRVQAVPIPGAEAGAEEAARRRQLIARLREQDALGYNMVLRGTVEGAVIGAGLQLLLAALFSGGGNNHDG
jgi:hypothetical protein